MKRTFFTLLILSVFSLFNTLEAQRPTQEALELETLYVEATRAKLLENHEEAIKLYKQILEKDNENDVVLFELAKVYLITKAPKEALDVIKKAVKLSPKNIWYLEELAAAHAANDDFISAAEVYADLVKQNPNERKFYYDLAFHYVKNNNLKEAIAVFNQHESKFGVSEEVIGRKFNLYRTLGNASKAEQELTKLSRAYPSNPEYALGLARFYEDINSISKAKNAYQRVLKIDPTNAEAQVALNKLGQGKSSQVDGQLWTDPEINIDIKISRIINSIQTLASASSEKKAEIIDITKTLTETHPKEAKAFAIHGDVLNFSGQIDEAINAYEKALSFEKNIFSVWNQLLSLYMYTFDMPQLLKYSEKALDYFPNEGVIYYLNGYAANYLSDYSSASSSLMQANIMSKSNVQLNNLINVQWAVALSGLGKMDQASEKILSVLDKTDNNNEILSEAGLFYLANGDTQEAERLVSKIIKTDGNQWPIYFTKAKIAYKKADYKKAKDILSSIEGKAPKSAFHVLELLGDTEFQLGNIDSAVALWKASKEEGNPSNALLKKITSRQI